MVTMRAEARVFTVFGLLAALAAGALGPCLCAPRAGESESHGCCASDAGLRPASPDCCGSCTPTLGAPAAARMEKAEVLALPPAPVAGRLAAASPAVVSGSAPSVHLDVPRPPTVLRI
jgi:hypothetical protein